MSRLTTFLNGHLKLYQPEKGYRFSLDAPILADFIRCQPHHVLLDIGTGSGIVPLILLKKKSFSRIFGVEIQDSLADLAERNVELNQGGERIQIIRGDIRKLESPPLPKQVDVVFSNPPYRRVGSGLLNPNFEKAAARHELLLTLPELMSGAACRLKPGGDFFLIHLGERQEEIMTEAPRHGFSLRQWRPVLSFASGSDPCMTLFQWHLGPTAGPTEHPPLVIYRNQTDYTDEFRRIISLSTNEIEGDE